MKPWLIVLIVVIVVLAVALFLLYRFGTKLQRRQEESEAQMKAAAQTTSMLVIDKKTMKLKEAGLPQIVIDQTPKYLRRSKVPIVKAKIGPRIMTLMCDPKVYDLIPVKKEIKAVLSGIYITDVKGLRSGLQQKPVKQSFAQKIKSKLKGKKEEPEAGKGKAQNAKAKK